MIDDGVSACITNNLKDFVGRFCSINQPIKGIAGHVRATHRDTVLWKIEDDTGKVHSININSTYYMAGVPNQILSPQHFAQAANNHHQSTTRRDGINRQQQEHNIVLGAAKVGASWLTACW